MAAPNKQVMLVAALFALAATSATVVVASSATVGAALSGGDRFATLPIALALTAGVVATVPASKTMARWGRRRGFQAFTLLGLVGALVCIWALGQGSFVAFCVGSMLIGTMASSSQYYRYAAGEVAAPGDRERAFGFVLAGGVLAGLLGPQAATWASDALPAAYVGTFLVVALLAVVLLLLLPFLEVPASPAAPAGTKVQLVVDRPLLAAVLAGVVGYGAMVLTMYAAPLSLHSHGHPFSTAAHVLQAHVVAMYLPSFVSGAFVGRVGPGRGMATGVGFLAACIAVNLAGDSVLQHGTALVLLGIGWNFLFVSGTALLARSHAGPDKASAQGANELLVGIAAAASAFLAGPTIAALGWTGLNLVVGLLVGAAALALLGLLNPWGKASSPAPAQT